MEMAEALSISDYNDNLVLYTQAFVRQEMLGEQTEGAREEVPAQVQQGLGSAAVANS
jgi:hypothetical protein